MSSTVAQRRTMVDTQLRTFDVTSPIVLEAIENVARENFVPPDVASLAYTDAQLTVPLSSGERRALLQPMVFARMLQALEIRSGLRALDVGGGAGYGAAVMAAAGMMVTALETGESDLSAANHDLESRGVRKHIGDLSKIIPSDTQYDVIFLHGAVEEEPSALLKALADGGRLVAIVGSGRSGRVTVFTRTGATIGRKAVFDASAPILPGFAKTPAFSL